MRNEKGEDWTKYLKEIKRLTPMVDNHLNGGSAVPILNRQSARAAGFQNLKEMEQSMAEKRQRDASIELHKTHLINKWFDSEFAKRLPKWVCWLASGRRNWVLKCLGFRWGYWDHTHKEEGMRKPMPATLSWLKWAWFVLAETRHVWDDTPEPKSRIIQP
jgi:hypothetical protein